MLASVCRKTAVTSASQWLRASYSTKIYKGAAEDVLNATKHKEAPQIDSNLITIDPKYIKEQEQLSELITLPKEKNLSPISGVPSEHIKTRRVRIFIQAKNSMQSGTNNITGWQIEFDNRERWENPLMGWSSSGDPLSNLRVEFGCKEEAIEHCQKNGWNWFIDSEEKPLKKRNKNYGVNFSWNRRTRVSTK